MPQTPGTLTVIGLAIVLGTVGILIRGRSSPIVVMTLVPILGALLAGFGIDSIAEFYGEGLKSVMNVVVMFIFAIVFFGIMQDIGLFTPLVKGLIIATRGRVMATAIGTAAIGTVAHLDGAGATTFLITIPALLPLYQALRMSRYVLLTIVGVAAGVMNMMPWAGPVGRAATVIDGDPVDIWRNLLPVQGIAIVVVFVIAAALGWREVRRISKLDADGSGSGSASGTDSAAAPGSASSSASGSDSAAAPGSASNSAPGTDSAAADGSASGSADSDGRTPVDVHALAEEFASAHDAERERHGYQHRRGRWVTIANVVLSLTLLAVLVAGALPPAPAFLIATAIALVLNFPTASEQAAAMNRHAPNALSMAGVILAAAMFLGVLNKSGMLEQIALSLLNVLPDSVGPWLHVAVGILGVPLDLLTSTDAYYFSVLPIVEETVANFGISGMGAATALITGSIIGTFVSPFSPALWLAIGLARANMGTYLKFAFPIAWAFGVSLVLVALGWGLLV